MDDKDFLCWIHERLEHVHGESPLKDYMHKLRAIIRATPDGQFTPNVATGNSLEDIVGNITTASTGHPDKSSAS